MNRITIPGSDLSVSPICVGCWQFNAGQVSADRTWEAQSEEISNKIVDKAFELGVNFFDTAEGYMNSEAVLGRCLQGRRKDVIVASKLGYGPREKKTDLTPEDIELALNESLKRLQTDYLDLYQVHWSPVLGDVSACIAELKRQQAKGRIRYYGVSNHGVQNMSAILEAGGKPLTNQLCYNLLCRCTEFDILPFCNENNISILPYSPLQQGLLTGKYLKVEDVPEGRRRTRHFSMKSCSLSRHGTDGCEHELFEAVNAIKNVCDKAGVAMSSASLSWLLQQQGVTSVIVGARSPEQLEQNCQFIKLSHEILSELTTSSETLKKAMGNICDLWGAENRIQ